LVFKALLTVSAFLLAAAPAAATLDAHVGQQQAELACGGALRSAAEMLKLAESDPDSKMDSVTKDFKGDQSRCPSPRYVNASQARASFAQAIVAHRAGGEWQATLDEAIADLTKCASDFSNDKIGDTCQTYLTAATKDKTDWASSPGGSPAATASP
jgi:hypothetical protein